MIDRELGVDPKVFNSDFLEKIGSDKTIDEVREEAQSWIREEQRENEFTRKIIHPQGITDAELDQSVDHDEPVKIVNIEPQAGATIVNLSGEGTYRTFAGNKAEMPFFTVESDRFETTESKIRTFEYPVTKIIEDKQISAMHETTDFYFTRAALEACAVTENYVTWDDSDITNFNRTAFKHLFDLFTANRLQCTTLLMSRSTWNTILTWEVEAVSDEIVRAMVTNGYDYDFFLQRKNVVTIKEDMIPHGVVFGFCDPQYLGYYFQLQETKFFIKKEGRDVAWWCWEDKGISIINNNAVGVLYPDSFDTDYGEEAVDNEGDGLDYINHTYDEGRLV